MAFFENKKWKRQDFVKEEQEKLDEKVYRTYRTLREIFRFVKEKHGDYLMLAF